MYVGNHYANSSSKATTHTQTAGKKTIQQTSSSKLKPSSISPSFNVAFLRHKHKSKRQIMSKQSITTVSHKACGSYHTIITVNNNKGEKLGKSNI